MEHGGLSIQAAMAIVADSAPNANIAAAAPGLQSYPSSNDTVSQLQMELLRNQPGASQPDPSQFPSSSSQHMMSSFQVDNYESQLTESTSASSSSSATAATQFIPHVNDGEHGIRKDERKGRGKRYHKPSAASGSGSSELGVEGRPIVAPQPQYPLGQFSRSASDPTEFSVSAQVHPEPLPYAGDDTADIGGSTQFASAVFHTSPYSLPQSAPALQEQLAFSVASSASTPPDPSGLSYGPSVAFSARSQAPDITNPAQSQSGQAVALSPNFPRPHLRHQSTALPTIQELMHPRINHQGDATNPAALIPPQVEQGTYQLLQQPEPSSSVLVESRRPSFNTILNNFIESLDSSSGSGQAQTSSLSFDLASMSQGSFGDMLNPSAFPTWHPNPLLPPIPEHEVSSQYSLLHRYNGLQQMTPDAMIPYEAHPVERATLAYEPTWMNGDTPTPEFEGRLCVTYFSHILSSSNGLSRAGSRRSFPTVANVPASSMFSTFCSACKICPHPLSALTPVL